MATSFALPALVELYPVGDDPIYITDESRAPIQVDLDARFIDKSLASGRKKRFFLRNCSKFQITWENVGSSADYTVDGFAGRDEIKALAYSSDSLSFVMRADDDSTMYDCRVFVTDYSEELTLRRGAPENFRYKISLGLEQVE